MKRFYKKVSVKRVGALFGVTLDERPIKTPSGEMLVLRSAMLADAIAAEWAGQGETVDQRSMSLTGLANTAIDRVSVDRVYALRQIEAFAGHDLVCYRAEGPANLVTREAQAWDTPLVWARTRHGLDLKMTTGLKSVPQPDVTFDRIERMLARYDAFTLTGLVAAAGIMKSLVLALSLVDGQLDAAAAHAAAHVDELFQLEKWGGDAEAETRLKALLAELQAAEQFIRLAAA